MERKTRILKNSENSANSSTSADNEVSLEPKNGSIGAESQYESDDNTPIQAPKPKRVQTEKQKQATALMRQRLAEKHARVKEEKARLLEEQRKLLEEKVIQKAVSIKKKQIKQQQVLDEISDDDTPIEEIIPIKRSAPRNAKVTYVNQEVRQAPPKQKVIFI